MKENGNDNTKYFIKSAIFAVVFMYSLFVSEAEAAGVCGIGCLPGNPSSTPGYIACNNNPPAISMGQFWTHLYDLPATQGQCNDIPCSYKCDEANGYVVGQCWYDSPQLYRYMRTCEKVFELKVQKTGNGAVTSDPIGINCGADCSEKYFKGKKVTIRAVPSTGSSFVRWSGACTGTSVTCVLTMDAAKDVTANFTGTSGGGNSERISIDGECGTAAKNYLNTDRAFAGSFCNMGISEPLNPKFPLQENSTTQWVCLGLTGGAASTQCIATRGNATPNACSVYVPTSVIPGGYGPPFNQLSSQKESTLSVECGSNKTTAVAGTPNTYVYKDGFVTENGVWKKIEFSGTMAANNPGWIKGTAVTTQTLPTPSSAQNFVIAVVCSYNAGKWRCGCRDSACAQNYWTIQAYKR